MNRFRAAAIEATLLLASTGAFGVAAIAAAA